MVRNATPESDDTTIDISGLPSRATRKLHSATHMVSGRVCERNDFNTCLDDLRAHVPTVIAAEDDSDGASPHAIENARVVKPEGIKFGLLSGRTWRSSFPVSRDERESSTSDPSRGIVRVHTGVSEIQAEVDNRCIIEEFASHDPVPT